MIACPVCFTRPVPRIGDYFHPSSAYCECGRLEIQDVLDGAGHFRFKGTEPWPPDLNWYLRMCPTPEHRPPVLLIDNDPEAEPKEIPVARHARVIHNAILMAREEVAAEVLSS